VTVFLNVVGSGQSNVQSSGDRYIHVKIFFFPHVLNKFFCLTTLKKLSPSISKSFCRHLPHLNVASYPPSSNCRTTAAATQRVTLAKRTTRREKRRPRKSPQDILLKINLLSAAAADKNDALAQSWADAKSAADTPCFRVLKRAATETTYL
jgi:hypothetical protein